MIEPDLELVPWKETFPLKFPMPVDPRDRRSPLGGERRKAPRFVQTFVRRLPRIDLRGPR